MTTAKMHAPKGKEIEPESSVLYAGILRFQKPISWRLCSAICGSRMQRLRPLSLPFCIARQKSVRALKTTTGEESKQLARNRIKHGHWQKPSLTNCGRMLTNCGRMLTNCGRMLTNCGRVLRKNKIENYATTSLDDTLAEDAK